MGLPLRWEPEITPEIQEAPANPAPLRRRRTAQRWRALRASALLFSLVAVLVLAAVGAQALWRAARPRALAVTAPASPGAQVRVASSEVERRLGFVTLTGSVANRTAAPLRNVEAVVELLDAKGRPVQMERALIGLDPLPAREDAPPQR